LVKKMLDPDPKLRLTAQEVLDHPWFINDNVADHPPTARGRLKARGHFMKMVAAHDVLGKMHAVHIIECIA
ncbi:calcium-dependent protein kinase 32-like protein, partial [Trifolium pratense]